MKFPICVAFAFCVLLCQGLYDPPLGVHLALAGTPHAPGMAVSWLTKNATLTSLVRYGLKNDLSDAKIALGYNRSYMSIWNHDVVLSNLLPSTKYYYMCGDDAAGWSKTFEFISRPGPSLSGPFSVAMFGDMGVNNSQNTVKQLEQLTRTVDFFYSIGDYAYADDRLNESKYEPVYDEFQMMLENITSASALMVLPGNHDVTCSFLGSKGCDPKHDNFTAYRYRFRMPFVESQSPSELWWSMDYGNVHFVSINTETDIPNSPEGPGTLWNAGPFGDQVSWLHNDLAKVNRTVTPWVVVAGHRPLYSTIAFDWPLDFQVTLRKFLEPILKMYDVDFYLQAHVHAYERMFPVYNATKQQSHYINPTTPIYVTNGAAGNIEGLEKLPQSAPDWVATRVFDDQGYAIMTFHNDTTVTYNYYGASNNTLRDSFVVVKDRGTRKARGLTFGC